jgi:hypothetical protein
MLLERIALISGCDPYDTDYEACVMDYASPILDFINANGNNTTTEAYVDYMLDAKVVCPECNFEDLIWSYEWKLLLDDPSSWPSEEDVTPVENGIEILNSHVPSSLPNNSVYIGGVPARDNLEDLTFGTNGDIQGIDSDMVELSTLGNDNELFIEMTDLFHLTSRGALEAVGDLFISHFRTNTTVSDFHNFTLSDHVRTTTKMKNTIKYFGARLNTALAQNGGNINDILFVQMPQRERPFFNSTWDRINGLTILVNDTEQTDVYQLTDFQINLSTGDWSGSFYFDVTDHFGLDREDAIEYQGTNDGFAAWWLLQHVRGYVPFKAKIRIVAKIKGDITP